MREFAPCNRHLSIERIEDEDEENVTTKVLLPDEYKTSKDHGIYRVVGSAPCMVPSLLRWRQGT